MFYCYYYDYFVIYKIFIIFIVFWIVKFLLLVFRVFNRLDILFLRGNNTVKNLICFLVFFEVEIFIFLLNGNVFSLFILLESVKFLVNRLVIVLVLVRVVLFFKERGNMWILVLIVDIFVLVMFLILWMLILIFCRI